MRADPKSVITTNDLTVFFTLLGSARAKASRRTLMKLTQDGERGKLSALKYKSATQRSYKVESYFSTNYDL